MDVFSRARVGVGERVHEAAGDVVHVFVEQPGVGVEGDLRGRVPG